MILIIGGTSDATKLSQALSEKKMPAVISVISPYGKKIADESGLPSIEKKMDYGMMRDFIRENDINIIIDASHPFSTEVSENAMAAAEFENIRYIRFERPGLDYPAYINKIKSIEDLEEKEKNKDKIYLSTGTNDLGKIIDTIDLDRLVARVLATKESIEKCEGLGLSPSQIHAINPPFSYGLNKELFIKSGARILLSKESGKAGGVDTKIRAAHDLGMRIYIIERPYLAYPQVYTSIGEVLSDLDEAQLYKEE